MSKPAKPPATGIVIGSFVATLVAAIGLIGGMFAGGLVMIWVSIGFCVLAMVLVGVGAIARGGAASSPSQAAGSTGGGQDHYAEAWETLRDSHRRDAYDRSRDAPA